MNKIYIYALIVLNILLITSCAQTASQHVLDYTTGTEGVMMKFEKNAPPDKVLEGNKIYPTIELWNKGHYDLDWAALYVDTDTKAIRLTQKRKDVPNLYGKNIYNQDGESTLITLDEYAPVQVPFGMSYKPMFTANLCYSYKTLLSPSVCVTPNPEELLKAEPVCRPTVQTFPKGQGAPVVVTKLETEPMQGFVTFITTIENKGNGRVVYRNSLYEKCPFKLNLNDVDLVGVDMRLKGLQEPECYPHNKIVRLVDGRGVISCKFLVRQSPPYTTPLEMTLDYGYMTSIKKQIEIYATEKDFTESFGELDSTPDGLTPASRVTASGECACEPTKTCLCVRLNSGATTRCETGTVLRATEGKNMVSVFPSDATVRSCIINSQSGPCNEQREIELRSVSGRNTPLQISGYDFHNNLITTANCEVEVVSVP